MRAYVSAVINTPINAVWSLVRDFNTSTRFYPFVQRSALEGELRGTEVGCIRGVSLKNGKFIREQLVALSDGEHSASYTILDGHGFPFGENIGTVRLLPITQSDHTFIEWYGAYTLLEGEPGAFRTFLERDIYTECINGLRLLAEHEFGDRNVGS